MQKFKYVLQKITESEKEGGIKLEYEIHKQPVKQITIPLGKLTKLHLYFPRTLKKSKQTIIFLKPLKSKWDKSRNRVSKNFWGKQRDPYMNMWVTINESTIANSMGETKRIFVIKDTLRSHTDHTLISYLNKQCSNFTLFIKQ